MNLQKVDKPLYAAKIAVFTILTGALLGLSIYYLLGSLSGIQQNIFEWLKSLIYEQKSGFELLPGASLGSQVLNIMSATFLTFFSYMFFSFCLSFVFYNFQAKKYNYKHLNFSASLKKAIQWQFYRYNSTFMPLLIFIITGGVLSVLLVTFFNQIMFFVGFNISAVSFVSTFIALNMLLLFSIIVLYSLWNMATLSFGTEISLSEPGLDNKKILLRSKRLIQTKPGNIMFLFINLIFISCLTFQFKNLDISGNIYLFTAFFLFNMISYAGIKYLKTSAYINSLIDYYKKVEPVGF